MQTYDIVMIVLLVAATAFGAYKGMAWQVASIAALFASYFVALQFRDALAPLLGSEAPWNTFLAMLILYLATSFLIWVAFRFVAGFLDRLKLKEFDRQIGALFGAAKGVLLCVAVTLFAVTLWEDKRDEIIASRSGYLIAVLLNEAHGFMPKEVHEVLHPYIHHLDPDHASDAGTHRAANRLGTDRR